MKESCFFRRLILCSLNERFKSSMPIDVGQIFGAIFQWIAIIAQNFLFLYLSAEKNVVAEMSVFHKRSMES